MSDIPDSTTLADVLRRQAQRRPDATAVVYGIM